MCCYSKIYPFYRRVGAASLGEAGALLPRDCGALGASLSHHRRAAGADLPRRRRVPSSSGENRRSSLNSLNIRAALASRADPVYLAA